MSLMTRRMGIVASVLLGAQMVIGCGGSAASNPPATPSAPTTTGASTTAEDDEATAGLTEHHRYHHHGGVTLFIAMSLDTLGVAPEQKAAVEKIRTDLHTKLEPARLAEQNLLTTLADGLGGTSIDAAKVDAAVGQVSAAAATVHDASADALNELHAVLTPAERAALVDKVESHWAVWQKANADETAVAKADDSHLATIATDLDLTPDQTAKIRAGLADGMKSVPRLDPQEVSAHLHAFDDAFRSDKFDAKTLTTANGANAHLAGWGASHMAHFVEVIAPVLTPEQRTTLAQRLREHATHDPSATQGAQ